ncbi:MAG: stage V sporulation protein AC [Clostridium sp.]|nr:stage V sporulation protein AC [Clostridium sp.]
MSSNSQRKEERIKKKYENMATEVTPKSKIFQDCLKAFLVGGLICDIGQLVHNFYVNLGFPEEQVMSIVPIVMIFLGALLTGTGTYTKLADFGGAGTVVPITGFSNAVVSPAIEFKKEGFVFGVAAKMFTIAGPVLVYGIGSSVIIGIIYYIILLIQR